MYNPIEFADPLVHFFILAIVGCVVFIGGLVALLFHIDRGNTRGVVGTVLIAVAAIAIAGFSACQLESEEDATEGQNRQSMIQNIGKKYTLDTSKLEVSEGKELIGHGTYAFTMREASAVKHFEIEFLEDGEPFIVVNNDMTSELAEQLLR